MPAQNQIMSQEVKKEFSPKEAWGWWGVEKINKDIEGLKPGILKKMDLIVKSYLELSKKNISEEIKFKLDNLKKDIIEITKLFKDWTFKTDDIQDEVVKNFFNTLLIETK